MNVFQSLGIQPGVTSIIGSGGKTSLLARLAAEAPGSVALVTTTHMFPIGNVPLVIGGTEEQLRAARENSRVICTGSVSKQGKLAQPVIAVERLAELFDFVLVEADGSKQLPLKAHAVWEPAVPEASIRTVLVVGLMGLGAMIRETVHRPELFCERASCLPSDFATAKLVGNVIQAERELGIIAPDAIVANWGPAAPHRNGADDVSRFANDLPIITCHLERPHQEPLP